MKPLNNGTGEQMTIYHYRIVKRKNQDIFETQFRNPEFPNSPWAFLNADDNETDARSRVARNIKKDKIPPEPTAEEIIETFNP